MQDRLIIGFKELFFHSWWVILFILFCFAGYEKGVQTINESHKVFFNQLTILQAEKKMALKEHAQLSMEVASQNDSDWIELTLKKELGLTPTGQTKVYFQPLRGL